MDSQKSLVKMSNRFAFGSSITRDDKTFKRIRCPIKTVNNEHGTMFSIANPVVYTYDKKLIEAKEKQIGIISSDHAKEMWIESINAVEKALEKDMKYYPETDISIQKHHERRLEQAKEVARKLGWGDDL